MSPTGPPGIFEDHALVGPEDDALQEFGPLDAAKRTRGRRARAASQPGSQHVELAAWRGWVEAVLDQRAGRHQASPRRPRADHVEVDVSAVAGDAVAKVLLVSERQRGEILQGIPWPASDQSITPVISSPATNTWANLQVAVREHRCPRPERSLGNPSVARDQVSGKDVLRDEPNALAVKARCDLVEAPSGPWRQRRVVQPPCGGTRRGPRRRRRGRRLNAVAECCPGDDHRGHQVYRVCLRG